MDLYFDRHGKPLDVEAFLRLRADEGYRVVAREQIGNISVCTTWLGTDQGPVASNPRPLVFGSAALFPAGRGALFEDAELLAATLEHALANQQALAGRVRSTPP